MGLSHRERARSRGSVVREEIERRGGRAAARLARPHWHARPLHLAQDSCRTALRHEHLHVVRARDLELSTRLTARAGVVIGHF